MNHISKTLELSFKGSITAAIVSVTPTSRLLGFGRAGFGHLDGGLAVSVEHGPLQGS